MSILNHQLAIDKYRGAKNAQDTHIPKMNIEIKLNQQPETLKINYPLKSNTDKQTRDSFNDVRKAVLTDKAVKKDSTLQEGDVFISGKDIKDKDMALFSVALEKQDQEQIFVFGKFEKMQLDKLVAIKQLCMKNGKTLTH